MRPKFLLTLVTVTTLILVGIFALQRKPQPVRSEAATVVVSPAPAQQASISPTMASPAMMPALPAPAPSPEEKQASIDQKVQQLQAWAQADDPTALQNIMNELATNSESKVRFAAIAAAKQSGNRDIIPALREAAGRTDDLKEKEALQQAADFLAQPTVSEQATNSQPVAISSL